MLDLSNVVIENLDVLSLIILLLISSDTAVHIFGFLVGSGDLNIYLALFFLLIITFIDILIYTFVYFLKRTKFIKKIYNYNYIENNKKDFLSILKEDHKKNIVLLFIIKILPASRVGIFLYALYKQDKPITFIKDILFINAVLFFPLFVSGYLVAKGILIFVNIEGFVIVMLYAFLFLGIVYIFGKKIKSIILNLLNKL